MLYSPSEPLLVTTLPKGQPNHLFSLKYLSGRQQISHLYQTVYSLRF